MSVQSPYAHNPFAVYTSLGPGPNGGFSNSSFGTPGLPNGFGFPSYGDPFFYFQPACSSFFINKLLGFANGSAVNVNIGPVPSSLGFGQLLLGGPFFDQASYCPPPGFQAPLQLPPGGPIWPGPGFEPPVPFYYQYPGHSPPYPYQVRPGGHGYGQPYPYPGGAPAYPGNVGWNPFGGPANPYQSTWGGTGQGWYT